MRTFVSVLLACLFLSPCVASALTQAEVDGLVRQVDDRQRNSGDWKARVYIERKETDKNDVVYDAVGSTATVLQALDGVRPGGRVIVIGIAEALVEVPLETRHLLRQKTLTGTMGGSIEPHRHIPEFVDLHLAGRLDLAALMDQAYSLDEIQTAFEDLEAGRITRGIVRF